MTEFINLTPHSITVEGVGTLPPSGIIARVGTMRTACGALGGARIVSQNFGAVEGIPAPRVGVTYIVSGLVRDALKREAGPAGSARAGRAVYAPDTGPDAIRENGQIVAVRGLIF
jgi:hypothetical protein